MLFKSFPFPGCGSDCCLGCCGAALLVAGMKRHEGQGGGGGSEDLFVTRSWGTLDRILCCCGCFEVVGNDRLIMLCLFAVGRVFVVDVGVRGGGMGVSSHHS